MGRFSIAAINAHIIFPFMRFFRNSYYTTAAIGADMGVFRYCPDRFTSMVVRIFLPIGEGFGLTGRTAAFTRQVV